MRDGLCALIAKHEAVEIVGAVSSASEALRSPPGVAPDIVVTDVAITSQSNPEMITRLKRRWPSVRVVVLTFRRDQRLLRTALDAGADAYVLKSDNCAELFKAIDRAIAGRVHVSPTIGQRATTDYLAAVDPLMRRTPTGELALTEREREVIVLITQGHRTRDIAELLSLSHKTIEKHRSSLMRKLGLRNATAVAAYAIAHGYVKL